ANSPRLKTRFEERTILLPADADTSGDFRQLKMVRGVPKVPDDAKTQGADGGDRHGDSAIAGVLLVAAAESDFMEYGYRAAVEELRSPMRPNHDDDRGGGRDWSQPPLGARLRGSI